MNSIIDSMLSHYDKSQQNNECAIREILQELVLCGLSNSDFFQKAAFNGGTSMRIYYGLDRFSEDLDFILFEPNSVFDIAPYLNQVENELRTYGIKVSTSVQENSRNNIIRRGEIKANTRELNMTFFVDDTSKLFCGNQLTRIKMEIDTEPAFGATYESLYSTRPFPYSITNCDLSTMFAGKIHAILCREWLMRVKGRDLYDFIFFVDKNVPVNHVFLQSKLIRSGYEREDLSFEKIVDLLKVRFNEINYASAKEDVVKFINPSVVNGLNVWSSDFFVSLCDKLRKV